MMEVPTWVRTDVSRETLDELQQFVELVKKWNPKINLVSKASIDDIWGRHIWDAVQILDVIDIPERWVDLGSGGGFPAIVVSILLKHQAPNTQVTLVESDQRKSAFLRTAVREIELNAKVLSERAESVDPIGADVVSARALADLDQLLGYAERHVAPNGQCIFPKGQTWEKEVKSALQNWSFTHQAHNSKTSPGSAILTIKDIKRV